MNKFLKWTPRILTIIFIVFITLLSFDVFTEFKFPEVLIALFMHLIPSLILVALLIFAWKKPKWGAWPFVIAGLFSIYFFKTYEDFIVFLIVSFPAILIGFMFYFSSFKRNN